MRWMIGSEKDVVGTVKIGPEEAIIRNQLITSNCFQSYIELVITWLSHTK